MLDGFFSPRPADWRKTQKFLQEARTHPSAVSKSIGTMRAYAQVIRRFLNHIKMKPTKATKRKVQEYFNHLSERKQINGNSQHTYFAAIRWFLTEVKGKKEFKIHLASIKQSILPMVSVKDFKIMLDCTQSCYVKKNVYSSSCTH
jgi:site-specific recombinase XerD